MVRRLEVLVEELSCRAVLEVLLPRIVPDVASEIRVFNGRHDLLKRLPQRLAEYSSWMKDTDLQVVVLLDRDRDDCLELKGRVEDVLADAGLVSLSRQQEGRRVDACTRIVIEHLEAWFFGDVPALRSAYPRMPESLDRRRLYRDPDAIAGGAWRALERLLDKHGYGGSLAKVATAGAIAPHMNIEANRSASFRAFRDGVRRLTSDQGDA